MGTTGDSLIYKSCEESVVDPRESLCYDPNGQVTHPTTIRHSARHGHSLMTCYDTIVVEVTAIVNQDDACSMAVYFGPRSRFNRRAVKDGCDWREGIAFVVFEALTHAIKIRSKISHKVKKILVMVDDAYLVDILTSNSNNTASRSIIIGQIRRRIYEFARDGVEIKFWIVRPRAGSEVDRMAVSILPEPREHSPEQSPKLGSTPGPGHALSSNTPTPDPNVGSPASYETEEISILDLER